MVNLRDVLNAFAASTARHQAGARSARPMGVPAPGMPRTGQPYPDPSTTQWPDLLANLARLSSDGSGMGFSSPLAEAAQSTQQEIANRLRAYQQAMGQYSADDSSVPAGPGYANASQDTDGTGMPEELLRALYAAQESRAGQNQALPALSLPALATTSPSQAVPGLPTFAPPSSRKRQAVSRHPGSARR